MIKHRLSRLLPLLRAGAFGVALIAAPVLAQTDGKPSGTSYELKVNEKGEPIGPRAENNPTSSTEVSSGTMTLLRAMETRHKDVKTIHATFHQIRLDQTFAEKVESDGQLWFDKPTSYRCDYNDPDRMINLIVNNTIYMYVPKLEQVEYYAFASPEERDQWLHQLLMGFGFKALDLTKEYEIHSSVDEAAPQAEFLKEKAELAKEKLDPAKLILLIAKPLPAGRESSPFKRLKVYLDKDSLRPRKIWYKDSTDSDMTLYLKTIEMNVKPDPSTFDKGKIFPPKVEYIDKRNAQ